MGNAGDRGDKFAHHAAAVARDLLGDENKQLSTKDELRFGKQGSMSVDVKTGQFFDHEQNEGGGVLWFIERETGRPVAGGSAVEWMRENGFDVEDDRPPAVKSGNGPRLDPDGNWLPQRVPDHGRLTKTFDYRDAAGELIYQVCRYDWTVDPSVNPKGHDKTFVQRVPDSKKPGGWSYKTKGITWLPYRLPELLADIANGRPIFIVEGEKKVDMLREIGVPATCNHGGAGKFPDDLAPHFRDAQIVVLPDNDTAGHDHAGLIARRLEGVARWIKTIELPGLPPKGGVDDWLPAGGSAEALYDLLDSAATPLEAAPFKSTFGAIQWADFDAPGPSYDYTIKGVLTRGEMSMLLGESQSGKSFLAIDIAMSIARGTEWFGHKVRQGGIIYQAGESALGVRRRRFPAYRRHYDCGGEPLPVVLLERPLDLYTNDEHVDLFIEECRHWGGRFDVPLELIVIDTFNKATPGANENDGKDMGTVLARCDRIRRETGAHVMLVQPHSYTRDSLGNDRPMRMYGVIPILVEDKTTRIQPAISMANEVKTDAPFSVEVSEANGEPMTYTLAIVDEGLLDLTRFKTPDPWNYFYAREALGVRTWDLYDQVIGAFGQQLQRVLALGGSDEASPDAAAKANRFKPVVRYVGPFKLGKGKKAQHSFTISNYVGSVRVMGEASVFSCSARKAVMNSA